MHTLEVRLEIDKFIEPLSIFFKELVVNNLLPLPLGDLGPGRSSEDEGLEL